MPPPPGVSLRARHCLPLLYHSSLINIRCLNAPSPRGFIKGQALGKFTSCEDGFFSPGLTIYRKVYPTKIFSSISFACLWIPVALLLKTSRKPIPPPLYQHPYLWQDTTINTVSIMVCSDLLESVYSDCLYQGSQSPHMHQFASAVCTFLGSIDRLCPLWPHLNHVDS